MTGYNRLNVTEAGEITVVRFRDDKLFEGDKLKQLGVELFRLVEVEERKKLLLNFTEVDFLSSPALGKLIRLLKKMRSRDGVLKLSKVSPEIIPVFGVPHNRLFDIHKDEAEALAAF